MKPSTTVSRKAWMAAAASALLYAAVWLIAHRLRPIRWAGDPELTALVAQQERLREFGDAACSAVRRQNDEALRHAWTDNDVRDFSQRLGPGWNCESRKAGDRLRHLVINRSAPRFDEWPAYVALVRKLESQPGLTVESLNVRAVGVGRHRRFNRLSVGLRFIMADATILKAERPAQSRGPLPLGQGRRPAATPKIGPVPSLSLPCASARPPASGPASAAVGADHPGPRAGTAQPLSLPKPPN